jgi:hypothetical protein
MGIQKSGEIAGPLDGNMPENCHGLHESIFRRMLRDSLKSLLSATPSVKIRLWIKGKLGGGKGRAFRRGREG